MSLIHTLTMRHIQRAGYANRDYLQARREVVCLWASAELAEVSSPDAWNHIQQALGQLGCAHTRRVALRVLHSPFGRSCAAYPKAMRSDVQVLQDFLQGRHHA